MRYPPPCRNLENIQADKTPGFIPEVLKLLRVCASKVSSARGGIFWWGGLWGDTVNPALVFRQLKSIGEDERSGMQLESGMLYALHLCECLFDPYQTWRRQLSG